MQTANPDDAYTPQEVFPDYTGAIEWLRSGSTVVDTGTAYEVRVADLGKPVSARATLYYSGYLPYRFTTASLKAVPGLYGGTFHNPTVTQDPDTMILTAAVDPGAVTADTFASHDVGAPTLTWNWLRDGAMISGATASTYHLTAADYGKVVTARATFTKKGYSTYSMYGDPQLVYSLLESVRPTFSGNPVVGETLNADDRLYRDGRDGSLHQPDTVIRDWYRNGVKVSSGTDYTLTPADKGKTISFTETATFHGLLTAKNTSLPVLAVGTTSLAGHDACSNATVSVDATSTSFKTVLRASNCITEPGVTTTYQWYRDTTKVAGATKVTYTLTPADTDKDVSVRVTTTKKAVGSTVYTGDVKESLGRDYTLGPWSGGMAPSAPGGYGVGQTLHADPPYYVSTDGQLAHGDTVHTYQWLRNGVVIPTTAANPSNQIDYVIQPADVGKRLSVRVVGAKDGGGFLPFTETAYTILNAIKGTFAGSAPAPLIDQNGNGKVQALAFDGPIPAPSSYTYQWLRGSTPIAGATAKSYTLTAADATAAITVRVTALRAGYNNLVLPLPAATVHGLFQATLPTITQPNGVNPGDPLGVTVPPFTLSDGTTAAPGVELAYQWYRNGVAISTAKTSGYVIQNGDLNKKITVRVTAVAPGFLAKAALSAPVTVVNPIEGSFVAPTVTKSDTTTLLTATMTPGSVATSGVQLSYEWLRNGTVIPGATSVTYSPVAADWNAGLAVRVHASKAGYASATVPDSSAINVSVWADAPVIDNTDPQDGDAISVILPTTWRLGGSTGAVFSPTPTITWEVNGVQSHGTTLPIGPEMVGHTVTLTVHVEQQGWLSADFVSTTGAVHD